VSRAYLRLDPALATRKEHYPDGALAAFVLTLCHAESQMTRGSFRTERILRAFLGKRARWVPYLLQAGDLIRRADGSIYVDGWAEWQEGDLTVGERVARLRARRRRQRADVTPITGGSVTGETVPETALAIGTSKRSVSVASQRYSSTAHATHDGSVDDCLACHDQRRRSGTSQTAATPQKG
jgi:hypothetical protein